ncbi:MAG: 23S rRNA (adenine(2503)-C(2))-methyltransferase RlmN [Candidatus Dadabacteria bacterium]|nr:23S rRNA (adenine(2503)-C(2))-methyltransferase RlmN [Candidatus Dadabacteria bacterium]
MDQFMQDNVNINIKDLSPGEIEKFVLQNNLQPFRARQIVKWLYKKGAGSFDEMTDLSKDFRDLLEFSFLLKPSLELVEEQVSKDGTRKYLFKLFDGNQIESVLIPDKKRNTLCISSQVGCALGCTFCMTGTVGKIRNLTPSEILDQYMIVNQNNAITNIVFMGMGEPLDNLQNLVKAINTFIDPNCLGLSPKRITVSTSGLVPQIKELGKQVSVNLAVSLNAPRDELRDEIMPINKRYPIKELLDASINFPVPNRKFLMFEYVLLKDINDSDSDAHTLGSLLEGIKCKINVIPFNEAYPLPYQSPSWDRVLKFQEILISYKINVRIRKSRGSDILGACGQLTAKYPSKIVKEPPLAGI